MTENKGDLISREALKKAIMFKDNANAETWEQLYDSVLEEIDNAPTVEEVSIIEFKEPLPPVKAQKIIRALNKRPQGEWLEMKRKIDNRHSVFIFKCPFCGYIEKCKANFCGKCGAEMKMRTTAD